MLKRLDWAAGAARVRRLLLRADAFVDSFLFERGRGAAQSYENFSAFMERFSLSGWRRFAVDLACEGLTLGLALSLVMVALALPAFRETGDDWMKKQDLAVTFLDRTGAQVGRRGILHDDGVPVAQMPAYFIDAVLATEDRRFFDHHGIDPIGTLRALSVNAKSSGVVQGGSTLTQQLAKNLFLSNERTLGRKINEAFLAVWLEHNMTKRQILQTYLDRVYMGGGTFGVEAAAEFYFGKSIRDVSLAEAAMLAGLFKAPTKYAPHINLAAARQRAGEVLSNLVDAGYMTDGQVYQARMHPASPVDRTREAAPDWYLDYAYDEVRALAQAGKLGEGSVLTVRTGLDTGIQSHSEAAIEDVLREKGPRYHATQSAMVLMEPDGAVRAIVGGRDYGESQFNRATVAQRQPGSSFKPFVYLTALKTGRFKPTTPVTDSPVCIGTWCVRNYEGEQMGTLPLWAALAHSLNTVAIKLSIAIGNGSPKAGRAKIVETAHALGITTPLEDTVSLPIGADVVTVIDMATAYSAFANGGKRIEPYAVTDVRDSHGTVVYRHDRDGAHPHQVEPAGDVATLNTMLARVVTDGTGRAAALDDALAVGKTGTTNAYRDAWFCGFTGNYVAAVWFGNDDYSPMDKVTGGTLPAIAWHDIMDYAHRGIVLKPVFGVATPAAIAALPPGEPPASAGRKVLSRDTTGALTSIAALAGEAAGAAPSGGAEGSRSSPDQRAELAAPVKVPLP